MVSSTVYGQEQVLDQIYGILNGFKYEVWMSHAGTVPIYTAHPFKDCLRAVSDCDFYFGIFFSRYGSGQGDGSDKAITHSELERAIELEKPRYVLAHEHIVNSRRFLMDLGFADQAARATLKLKKGASIIDDLRLIDMYEAATRENLPMNERKNSWVQKFRTNDEVFRFVEKQFADMDRLRALLENAP